MYWLSTSSKSNSLLNYFQIYTGLILCDTMKVALDGEHIQSMVERLMTLN